MAQKVMAILLVLTWIAFSDVDMLEDLDVENHSTPSASNSPTTAKPVKLANDNVELANRTSTPFEKSSRRMDPDSKTGIKLAGLSLHSGALRSHKDNCVFLI